MPLYEYRCQTCRHEFDRLRPAMHADDVTSCPTCGDQQVERKLSVFAPMKRTNAAAPIPLSAPSSGGCCGGACGCGSHN